MKIVKLLYRKMKTLSKHPNLLLIKPFRLCSPLMDDKVYMKWLFFLKMGYRLNLNNPRSYSEKLQWLKLYYRKPILTKLVDKYEVKKHVQKVIGKEYTIKNYGVWNSFDEIDFESLPAKFVLKTTHDSGGVVICKDKAKFNKEITRERLSRRMRKNYYYMSREWPYKHVKPRIIAEEFLVDESRIELKDYKFFCFNGEPKLMFIATGRQVGEVLFDFYDIDFCHLNLIQEHKQSKKNLIKPKNYEKMVELAAKLSAGLPHVRIDLYNIDGRIIFGEYTFFHFGGMVPFRPKSWDYKLGSWIDLSNYKSTESGSDDGSDQNLIVTDQ